MKPTLCTGSGYQMLLLLLACTYANGIRSVLQVNRFTNIYMSADCKVKWEEPNVTKAIVKSRQCPDCAAACGFCVHVMR